MMHIVESHEETRQEMTSKLLTFLLTMDEEKEDYLFVSINRSARHANNFSSVDEGHSIALATAFLNMHFPGIAGEITDYMERQEGAKG